MKNVFILLLLIIFLSCIKADDKIPPTNFKLVKELLSDGFKFKIGNTVEEVKKNLGEPKNIKVEKHVWVEDQTYDVGRYYTLIYDGIEIVLYEYNETKEQFLTSIIITSKKYEIKNNIKIGLKKNSLLKILGNYGGKKDNLIWYYVFVDNEPDLKDKFNDYHNLEIIFLFKDDKVNEIVFLYECNYADGGDRVEVY